MYSRDRAAIGILYNMVYLKVHHLTPDYLILVYAIITGNTSLILLITTLNPHSSIFNNLSVGQQIYKLFNLS